MHLNMSSQLDAEQSRTQRPVHFTSVASLAVGLFSGVTIKNLPY